MSGGNHPFVVHNDETYRINQERIEQAQQMLDMARQTNEQGRRNFEQMEADLRRKMQEGQEAQRMLMAMQQQKPMLTYHDPNASSGPQVVNYYEPPLSARIEEVPSPNRPAGPSASAAYRTNYAGPSHQTSYQASYAGPSHQAQHQHHQPAQYRPQQPSQEWQQSQQGTFATQMFMQSNPRQRHSATPPYVPPNQHSWHDPQPSQPNYVRYSPTIPQQQQPSQQPIRLPSVTPMQSRAPSESQSTQYQSRSSAPPQPPPQQRLQHHPHPPQQPQRQPNGQETRRHSAVPHPPPQQHLVTKPPPPVPSTSQQIVSRVASQPPANPAPAMPKSTAASSYGLSPFAYVPARVPTATNVVVEPQPQPVASTSKAPSKPVGSTSQTTKPVASTSQVPPEPVASTSQAPKPITSTSQALSKPVTSNGLSKTAPEPHPKAIANQPAFAPAPQTKTGSGDKFDRFLRIIDLWQKGSPGNNAMLDIPYVQIKVFKRPLGVIHFVHYANGVATRVSALDTFNRLSLTGADNKFTLFKGPNGVPALLIDPLPPNLNATHKPFEEGYQKVPGTPDATFPDPPDTNAPTDPHDVLKALGRGRWYAAEDDSVRYAKRRAIEAPRVESQPAAVPMPVPVVAPFVVSQASAARTTAGIPVTVQPVQPPPSMPLFFPPSSPPPTTSSRKRLVAKAAVASNKSSAALRLDGPSCYVLVPPAPEYVKRDWEKMLLKDEPVVEEPPEDETGIDVEELKRRRALGMYQNTESEEEAAAMLEAYSRIQEVTCMWNTCEVVLNSFENLIAHLHKVHAQETDEHFTCMWDLCGESFVDDKQLGMHAETHILATIYCARLDCNEMFATVKDLVAHNLGHVEQKTELKPSARPTIVLGPLVNPELPASVPAWGLFAPGVAMPSIPLARHEELGPWVLRHIYAPVNVRAKRYNEALHPGPCEGDFEFLQTRARPKHYSNLPSYPAKVREMADLNSKEVSDLIANGELVLWPSQEKDEGELVLDTSEDELAVAGMLTIENE